MDHALSRETRNLSAPDVVESILRIARVQAEIGLVASELKLSGPSATERTRACLKEMVAVQKPWVVAVYRWAMRPLHAGTWDVRVDEAALQRLARLNESRALIFLPSHRSYADPLVLGALLDARGFPANFTLPGANMAFWPLGPLLRRAGGITIRRSFRDDAIYKLALREYFGHLVARRTNLEWYIEGGRSRTGKLRPPRYGLLRYLLDAIQAKRADDAILVPVSITYDELPEVQSMAAEEHGATKQPEGLGWLARYVRQQRNHVGAVHVRFGEPLALSEGLAAAEVGVVNPRLAVERIAFEVCDRINRATPVMANALATLALLGVRGRALTMGQVVRLVAPLLDYVVRRDLPTTDVIGLRTAEGTRPILLALGRARVVTCYDGGAEAVYGIAPGQHNVAAFYRNAAIHWFVNRAIVELAFLSASEQGAGDPREKAWNEALRLRDLLKFEFFFARRQVFGDQLMAELALIDASWQSYGGTPEQARALLAKTGFLVAHRVLRSFLESYFVVADLLATEDPGDPWEESAFIARCLAVGHQYQLQRLLIDPESVSREGFLNALKLARNRGLLDLGDRESLGAKRLEFKAQLRAMLARVAAIDEIEARRTKELHVVA